VRIVQANAVYDPALRTPSALLEAYHTLTVWSEAVARAGAHVSVVQRFKAAAMVDRDGIGYQFVPDPSAPWLSTQDAPPPFVAAVAALTPDVVHVNGLIFPQLVKAIRAAIGPRPVIVAQHHGGEFPIRGSGLVGMWQRKKWRDGLAAADAISFTAREQAEPWLAAGVLGPQRVVEIVEASTRLRAVGRDRARSAIGADGDPLILWVGRLTTNKDPLTVLDGLERALPHLPDGRAIMAFDDATLLPAVDHRVRESEFLKARVTLAGAVSRDEIPNYYGAADVFVSGSHSEGSGYSLIEALSMGVVPVVTDIPSFRVIAGDSGGRWAAGDPDALSRTLVAVCRDLPTHRLAARAQFDRVASWEAIAERTVSEYRRLLGTRLDPR
jgi:glycosyltransferase involved in cell wall biosynthesis